MRIEPADLIDTRLRVATWNVWWRFGPWAERQPAIAETLRRIDADVIALQEVWDVDDGPGQSDRGSAHAAHRSLPPLRQVGRSHPSLLRPLRLAHRCVG